MDKFNALLQLFIAFGVHFNQISSTEIVVECPCDIVNSFDKVDLCQEVIIADPTTCGGWDEIRIHITYNPKYDCLDWLVVDYMEEERN